MVVSNLSLLSFSLASLLLIFFFFGCLILIEVTSKVVELLPGEFDDLIYDLVEEVTSMGYDQHSDVKACDILLEPNQSDEIQVIGGLVQQ